MANKRIRSRRNSAKDDLLTGLELPVPKKPRSLSRQASNVSAEIHRLECVIAAAPSMQKQRQLRWRDTLPPMEDQRGKSQPKQATLPLHAQSLRRQQRLFQVAQIALIILAITAVAGWMKQWGN